MTLLKQLIRTVGLVYEVGGVEFLIDSGLSGDYPEYRAMVSLNLPSRLEQRELLYFKDSRRFDREQFNSLFSRLFPGEESEEYLDKLNQELGDRIFRGLLADEFYVK